LISIWSYDDGFGDNKLFNGIQDILVPTHCTHWRERMRSDNVAEGEEIDPLSHIGIEVEGLSQRYLVGEGALKQASNLNWTGGSNKHKDLNFPIIAKTCLSVMAGNRHEVVVEPLVMSLPVKQDESEDRHKLLEEIMLGTHKATLYLAGQPAVTKVVHVKELITKKQPFGGFCEVILDNNGEIADKETASQFVLIVDIGTRTLNIYTLDGLSPVTELSDTKNQGVYTAYQLVNDFIEGQFQERLPDGKIIDVVQRRAIKGFDLSPIIDYSYRTLANEVFRIVDKMFVDSWVYVDKIIVTGGGAELLEGYLKDLFPVKPIFLNRYSNARGLWKYGVRHAVKVKKTSIQIALPNGGVRKVGKPK
jgi:plasmid segregation protein ParM